MYKNVKKIEIRQIVKQQIKHYKKKKKKIQKLVYIFNY